MRFTYPGFQKTAGMSAFNSEGEELPSPEAVTLILGPEEFAEQNSQSDPLGADPLCVEHNRDHMPVQNNIQEREVIFIKCEPCDDEDDGWTESLKSGDIRAANCQSDDVRSNSVIVSTVSTAEKISPEFGNKTICQVTQHSTTKDGISGQVTGTQGMRDNVEGIAQNQGAQNKTYSERHALTSAGVKTKCVTNDLSRIETRKVCDKTPLRRNKELCVLITRSDEAERLASELVSEVSPRTSNTNIEENKAPSVPVEPSRQSVVTQLHNTISTTDVSSSSESERVPPVRLRKINATGKWQHASLSDVSEVVLDSDIENVIGTNETLLLMKRAGILEDVRFQNSQLAEKGEPVSKKKNISLKVVDSNCKAMSHETENVITSSEAEQQAEELQMGTKDKQIYQQISEQKMDISSGSFPLDHSKTVSSSTLAKTECVDCHRRFQSMSSWRGHRPSCPVRRSLAKVSDLHCLSTTKLRLRKDFRSHLRKSNNVMENNQTFANNISSSIVMSSQNINDQSSHTKDHFEPPVNSDQDKDYETSHVKNNINSCLRKSSRIRSDKSSHVTNDLKAMKFACKICGKILSCRTILLKHTAEHRMEMPFWCHLCGRGFANSVRLKTHLRIHTGIRPYACGVCGNTYTTRDAMRLHKHKLGHVCTEESKNIDVINQSDPKTSSLQCDICENEFLTVDSLKIHKAIHTKVPFDLPQDSTAGGRELSHEGKLSSCLRCGKKFSSRFALNAHMKLHKNEQFFYCQLCNKKFSSNHHLKEHQRFHAGNTSYQCTPCEMAFRTADGLRHHHNEFHSDNSYHENLRPRKEFPCYQCKEVFPTLQSLKTHSVVHSSVQPSQQLPVNPNFSGSHSTEKKLVCPVCDKTLASKINLETHMLGHLGKKPYKCQVCGKSFANFYRCKRHQHSHSEDTQRKCYVCDKTFSSVDSFWNHNELHRKEHNFISDLCGKVFGSDQNEESFENLRNGKKSFYCISCKTVFATTDSWIGHNLSHLKEMVQSLPVPVSPVQKKNHTLEFPCNVCGVVLSTRESLKKHTFLHVGKPLDCEMCNKRFSIHSHLEDHMRTHTQERPFRCNVCQKEFTGRSELRKHKCKDVKNITFVSMFPENFKCGICNKIFNSITSLKKHTSLIHVNTHSESPSSEAIFPVQYNQHSQERSHSCSQCGNLFVSRSDLSLHMLTHAAKKSVESFQSGIPLAHTRVSSLTTSKKTFNVKRYKCKECKRAFTTMHSLTRHKLIHTGQKPFPCELCGATFREKYRLKLHMRNHSSAPLPSILLPQSYKCEQCDKTFVKRGNFIRHRNEHASNKMCITDKSKRLLPKFGQMLKQTTKKLSFQCDVCLLCLPSALALASHKRCHKDAGSLQDSHFKKRSKVSRSSTSKYTYTQRKYKCNVCRKILGTSNSLSRHKLIHTGEYPFPCHFCDYAFREKNKLRLHVTLRHMQSDKSHSESHKCKQCNKTFLKQGNLIRHSCLRTQDSLLVAKDSKMILPQPVSTITPLIATYALGKEL